jgi:hypothetical protein
MLVVLLTLTVIVSAVAVIARTRTTEQLVRSHAVRDARLAELLQNSDAPIRAWLDEVAGGVVLPPETVTPMIRVTGSSMVHDGEELSIQITAWDQLGLYPRNLMDLGIDLSATEVAWKNSVLPGVDEAASRSAFPSAQWPASTGGLVATHNPWPTRSGATRSRSGAQININTAPQELIVAVFEHFQLGDPSWIFVQRAAGEFVTMTQQIVGADRAPISLVSVSRVWSFRIDARIGTIRRSCWCVYAKQGGKWRMVQRIAID